MSLEVLIYGTVHSEYIGSSPIQNYKVYYQGYFCSADTGVRPSKWSPVKLTNSVGQYSIRLETADWLGPSGTIASGDKIIMVFWYRTEDYTSDWTVVVDRLDPEVLDVPRGWLEITSDGANREYRKDAVLLPTQIGTWSSYYRAPSSFSGDFGSGGAANASLNTSYQFNMNGYLYENFFYYQFNYKIYGFWTNTDGNIDMSHEAETDGEQIFPIITNYRQIIRFSPDTLLTYLDFTNGVTNSFNYTFTVPGVYLVLRTLSYEVAGVWFNGTKTDLLVKYEFHYDDYKVSKAAEYDVNVYKDRDFNLTLGMEDIEYWTFKAQIKETPESKDVLAEFTITKDIPNSKLILTLDSYTTKDLVIDNKKSVNTKTTTKDLYWDLSSESSLGSIYNLIHGKCVVNGTITRN